MKNFPNTRSAIESQSIIGGVTPTLHAEWNLNRYIASPTLEVNDSLPQTDDAEDLRDDSEQIAKKFPIESVVKMHRGNKSAYVIAGTKYRSVPTYENQEARSDVSWQDDTTWLWYSQRAEYKYWVSSLRAESDGSLPYNVGRILFTWPGAKPMNKLHINFQPDHAFPTSWSIYVDVTGNQTWQLIANNPTVPASGKFNLYRTTTGSPTSAGTWGSTETRLTSTADNHINCFGVRILINSVDISRGRPGIIEISPKLEADLSEYYISYDATEELSDQDFINPMGSSSANTGSVKLSNSSGIFNEQDSNGLLYNMMDEEVRFRGYWDFQGEKVPMFNMLSDSWDVTDFDSAEVSLVDDARKLQNIKCKDMIVKNVNSGVGLHMLFASLGLEQFNLNEVTAKQTPSLEFFYSKKEQKVWELITDVCKGLQMSAVFDSSGVLQVFSKERTFNTGASIDWSFTSETGGGRVPDLISAKRSENSRFNKVTVKFNSTDNFALSKHNQNGPGRRNQKFWGAPDPWIIGAASVVRNITSGDNYFMIDPNKPEALPRYSGKVHIQGINNTVEYEGKGFYCRFAAPGNKYIRVNKPSEYGAALERNDGQAPKFTGKIFLKDGATFNRDFSTKDYEIRQNWDIIEFQENSSDGIRKISKVQNAPKNGVMAVKPDYKGSRRLNITKKGKNWIKYDRVGMKFRVNSPDAKAGIVVWPQGPGGGAGYYFVVNPMTNKQIKSIIKAGGSENNAISAPPPVIKGFKVKPNGHYVDMEFDTSDDWNRVPPLRTDRWAYIEVQPRDLGNNRTAFDVFINGVVCKRYFDSSEKLTKNHKAGMTFMGDGNIGVDKFYVVTHPDTGVVKSNDNHVSRRNLWINRKHSSAEEEFNKYLRSLEKEKKTKVFESDFSGRYYAIARERITEKVRFEEPALTSHLTMTNSGVDLVDYEHSAFGARFVLMNRTEDVQLLQGSKKTKYVSSNRDQALYINGASFRRGQDQEVEHKKDSLIDRIGELPIEFESEWIQDIDTANDLAEWIMDRFGENAEVYELEVVGNPLLEVGDVVSVEWPEKGMSNSTKWCLSSVKNSWSDGPTTSVTIRKII